MGFKEAAAARPARSLLEPIMEVEVTTAGDFFGDVHRRPEQPPRAHRGHGARAATRRSFARYVPLAEMFGYATDLRSMTQGRATYTMEFAHYEQVPRSIADEMKAKASVTSRCAHRPLMSELARGTRTARLRTSI